MVQSNCKYITRLLQSLYIDMKKMFQSECWSSNSVLTIVFPANNYRVSRCIVKPGRNIERATRRPKYQYFFSEISFPFSSHIYHVPDFLPLVYCIS